jgi:hypothetical protein
MTPLHLRSILCPPDRSYVLASEFGRDAVTEGKAGKEVKDQARGASGHARAIAAATASAWIAISRSNPVGGCL